MNQRFFWVRSASTEGAEIRTPVWAIKTLKMNYPGFMGNVSAFYATLLAGHTPHDMHTHAAEEILVVRSGRLDVLTAGGHQGQVGPGGFFHVAPGADHTIRSVGPEPAHLVVFKWACELPGHPDGPAEGVSVGARVLEFPGEETGIRRQRIWHDRPLANGGTLVAEAIHLARRNGYAAHSHDHDLMLVLLRGRMHALGHTTDAPAVIYYPAGMVHALAPLNEDPIEMLAFEFHRSAAAAPGRA